MRHPLFLLVLFGLLGFGTADLRHAYDSIATFLAYRAELLLLPPGQRIIGMKCAAADPETLECLDRNPRYKACKGTAKVNSYGNVKIKDACSLREFLSHISGGKQHLKTDPLEGEANDWSKDRLLGSEVGENALYFDVDYAAKQMVDLKIGPERSESWCKVKEGADKYEDTVTEIGRRIFQLDRSMTPEEREKHQRLFDGIYAALDGVVLDRRCDISKRLIPALKAKNIDLVVESVSGNRQLFKDADTRHKIQNAWEGKPNAEDEIDKATTALDDAIEEHFLGDSVAANHRRVANLFAVYAPSWEPDVPCTPR